MGKEKESRNAVGVAVRREDKNVYEGSDAAGNLSFRVSADHVDIGEDVVCGTEISGSRKKMMWVNHERNLAVARRDGMHRLKENLFKVVMRKRGRKNDYVVVRRLEDGDQVIFIEYDLLKWKDLEWGDIQ